MPIIQTTINQSHKNAEDENSRNTFRMSTAAAAPATSFRISTAAAPVNNNDRDISQKILDVIGEDYTPTNYLPLDSFDFNVKNKNHEVVEQICYPLSLPQKIFLFLEMPECCILARYSSYIMMLTIAVSCISFVLSSVASFRHRPNSCANPVCENDVNLCPNAIICEPVEDDYFFVVETICVIIFTIDYLLRIMTVGSVPPRLSRLLPQHIKHRDPKSPKVSDPIYTWKKKLWIYASKPFNVIDLVAIAPYYISFVVDVGSGFVILRVLRLIRVFRILKSKNVRAGLKIIQKSLMDSLPALSILSFLTLLLVLLFGSLIFFFEGGEYTVDSSYPSGAYVRWNINHSEKEESPFSSILLSIYWAVVTGECHELSCIVLYCLVLSCIVLYCGRSLIMAYFHAHLFISVCCRHCVRAIDISDFPQSL
jgi:hypothetical protein